MGLLEFIKLIAAFGIGGIITKLLDVYMWSDKQANLEKEKWLREKKLEAFNEFYNVISEIYFKKDEITQKYITELDLIANKVLLLINDTDLISQIREMIHIGSDIHSLINDYDKYTSEEMARYSLELLKLQEDILIGLRNEIQK